VGRGSERTFGSSYIRHDRGRVAARRIDLVPDADGRPSALAHELSHVILADRFRGMQPPRWVDEGIATLADSADKRRRHERDCHFALDSGGAIPLGELLRLDNVSSAQQAAVFYGQSVSLVRFLVEQDTPERFLAMVEIALHKGYDRALSEAYGINNVGLLERQWREFAAAPAATAAAVQTAAFRRDGGAHEDRAPERDLSTLTQ
jgi:hypothetical protein